MENWILMRSERFFCKRCNRFFDELKFYDEKHGLDNPPYERVAVCPICNGGDFMKFNCFVEKIEVAEKILPVIMYLNRYINSLKDVFGGEIRNNDLFIGVEAISELIDEMFDFMDVDTQLKILKVDNERELKRILTCLKGEL